MNAPPAKRYWLPERLLTPWAMAAAFGTYFCMYGFRKPFTAAEYADQTVFGIPFKDALVTAQLMGYMFSKMIGIRVMAELKPHQRAFAILVTIGISEFALLLFAVVPPTVQPFALFLNGLPLGMVFGFVLSYLEGRKLTELLTAGLCASFIVSSGVVKSLGATLISEGVPTVWMPFLSGLVFVPPLFLCVWMLQQIPPPSVEDKRERSERGPITREERWGFFRRYAPGICCLLAFYSFTTVVRTFRDDYGVEIWKKLGYEGSPKIFTFSEAWVMLGVVILNGSAVLIRKSRAAFNFSLFVSFLGACSSTVALLGHAGGWLSPFMFMVLMGLGLYLPYVAIHTTVFERLLAITRERGNTGFLLYLADTAGYLVYVLLLLARRIIFADDHPLELYITIGWVNVAVSVLAIIGSVVYFHYRLRGK
jgi:hypothetical protein